MHIFCIIQTRIGRNQTRLWKVQESEKKKRISSATSFTTQTFIAHSFLYDGLFMLFCWSFHSCFTGFIYYSFAVCGKKRVICRSSRCLNSDYSDAVWCVLCRLYERRFSSTLLLFAICWLVFLLTTTKMMVIATIIFFLYCSNTMLFFHVYYLNIQRGHSYIQ